MKVRVSPRMREAVLTVRNIALVVAVLLLAAASYHG